MVGGTGNGFYAQSEIYGGRYARAKIILTSERKGGKVSQAGWLAGWPCFGQGISSIIIIINARAGRHCWLCHPLPIHVFLPSPRLHPLSTPPSSRAQHTHVYRVMPKSWCKERGESSGENTATKLSDHGARVTYFACLKHFRLARVRLGRGEVLTLFNSE